MARDNNFLLGRGEALTEEVSVLQGFGDKNPPYTFASARAHLAPQLAVATESFQRLPPAARPDDQVVAVVTMHPRYISKSDFPSALLGAFDLKAVGSRTRRIRPRNWGVDDPPESALSNEIFVTGPLSAFYHWSRTLPSSREGVRWADDLTHVEDIAAFNAEAKLRSMSSAREAEAFEVVIHNASDERIIRRFIAYSREVGVQPLPEWRRDVGGLTFLPVRGRSESVRRLADFSFVRVARPMPRLRALGPDLVRFASIASAEPPDVPALDQESGVVIFDGGLPPELNLARWVTLIEPQGIGPPSRDHQEHGLAVTSSVLFGNLGGAATPQAMCHIDHVRILDAGSSDPDLEYLQVLDRIISHLESTRGKYSFGNISVGPQRPIDDDEVTQWTAQLDQYLADGAMLTSVAVGNDGEADEAFSLNRIQPPSDGVNVLSVGACDANATSWRRAPYSCVGPGRAPGIVKPDGVTFGGTEGYPYFVFASRPTPCAIGVTGTSIAAPHALRSGISVRAQLGNALSPMAIRALMIHRAEGGTNDRREVGWGRFVDDPGTLITCEDVEGLVIYQGIISVDRQLRAKIAIPKRKGIKGMVDITATLVISTEVDPEHAGAYTRSGVRVVFRPHSQRFTRYPDGSFSSHPTTKAFFSQSNMYAAAEYELQDQGQKWEPCLRATRRMQARSVFEPCFDISYQHRDGLSRAVDPNPISYALIVTVRAPKVPDFYSQIVRDYANVLIPIRPKLRIPVRA